MPVNLLYCEGVSKGSDTRVLSALFSGIPVIIKPIGSKHGAGRRVIGARDIKSGSNVFGLKDRDFDDDDSAPVNEPREWKLANENIGWSWERKEIENYLIDPKVVKHALNSKAPPPDQYFDALQKSAEVIANYTAARIALSLSRVRVLPLNNFWGKEREKGYSFPKEKGVRAENCRSKIASAIEDYKKHLTMSKEEAWDKFDQLCRDCNPGGCRFKYFTIFFAGKDLLYGMRKKLKEFGFKTPLEFRERVLKGIENSTEDAWTWLSEWQKLREYISN